MSVGTQISIKAPVCSGDFPMRLIERSISHHKQKGGLPRKISNVKIQSVNRHGYDFLCENSEWEKSRGRERGMIHYFLCVTKEFFLNKYSSSFSSSSSSSFLWRSVGL